MSNSEFDAAVAAATGDTIATIRRRGFSILTRGPVELEPDDLRPPQIIDWDSADANQFARFIDELID